MKSKILAGSIVAIGILFSPSAYALDCKASVTQAETSVASATEAMKAIKEAGFKARVRVLVDDATMLARSSKRLCDRSNATKLTMARAQAQAKSAVVWAAAAKELAAAYENQ